MIRLLADAPAVFQAAPLPPILRLYEWVGDDRDAREYRAHGRKSSLVRYGVRLAVRRILFPWLLAVAGLRRPHFLYGSAGRWIRIRFDPRNGQFLSVYGRRFQGRYEPRVAGILAAVIPRDRPAVFFDVGSNWGHFPLYAAGVAGPGLEIHAFEPTRSSFADLRSSVEQAGLEGRIHCHHLAVGDRHGQVTMSMPRRDMTGLATVTGPATGPGAVPCRPLDSLDLPRPDVLKVDVEGHEAAVFRGARGMLGEMRPHVIFESTLHDGRGDDVAALRILVECGYRLFEPVWETDEGSGPGLTRDDHEALRRDLRTIVLRPVTVSERTLLPPAVDLFACHESRLGELTT
jgi:FkbM family methyltransferase